MDFIGGLLGTIGSFQSASQMMCWRLHIVSSSPLSYTQVSFTNEDVEVMKSRITPCISILSVFKKKKKQDIISYHFKQLIAILLSHLVGNVEKDS